MAAEQKPRWKQPMKNEASGPFNGKGLPIYGQAHTQLSLSSSESGTSHFPAEGGHNATSSLSISNYHLSISYGSRVFLGDWS